MATVSSTYCTGGMAMARSKRGQVAGLRMKAVKGITITMLTPQIHLDPTVSAVLSRQALPLCQGAMDTLSPMFS